MRWLPVLAPREVASANNLNRDRVEMSLLDRERLNRLQFLRRLNRSAAGIRGVSSPEKPQATGWSRDRFPSETNLGGKDDSLY